MRMLSLDHDVILCIVFLNLFIFLVLYLKAFLYKYALCCLLMILLLIVTFDALCFVIYGAMSMFTIIRFSFSFV